MWRLGFFFHEIAFGLLSVFIPLYVVTFKNTELLGGPLVALGVMTSIAIFCTIPASFLWGYLCDSTRHYKIFIMLSFSTSAVILFLMTLPFAQNIILFVVLYVVMQMLHVAHEAPKNILIAEHYSREDWESSYGLYEGLTEIGFIIGLGIGLFAFASSLSFGAIATYTLYLCSGLSFVAFILAIVLIADPLMIFERRLVGIEKRIDYTYRGVEHSSRLMDGLGWDRSLKEDNFLGFALAIVLFSLATSLFFTPLPIFLNKGLGLSESWVYVAYILNSVGATVGLLLHQGKSPNHGYPKTDASLRASSKPSHFWSGWGNSIRYFAQYLNRGCVDFHRLCICNVFHYDAFAFDGAHTGGQKWCVRCSSGVRCCCWFFPWAFFG